MSAYNAGDGGFKPTNEGKYDTDAYWWNDEMLSKCLLTLFQVNSRKLWNESIYAFFQTNLYRSTNNGLFCSGFSRREADEALEASEALEANVDLPMNAGPDDG